ncbi:L-selectin-like [Homarus americanus]|uniref:L-selectin-like 1 n=1 Tax=Homarus americanus TaxID=6706 RepID=A0A8J5NCP1_HOMAM|nr:L-selectin-like [Homarus americanus]KAG7177173.1 L-selectin-like 1 [Homarus americanus]
MKAAVLLVFVGVIGFVSGQNFHSVRFSPFGGFRRPLGHKQFARPTTGGFNRASSGSGIVDATSGQSEYHFSFKHAPGEKFSGGGARVYCQRQGPQWDAVAISSEEELRFIHGIVGGLPYIWTGGYRTGGRNFAWHNGESFNVQEWSHTGQQQRPQPDNRENQSENCLAILNNFYRDGVKWHDVACHHQKPVVCERHI